MEISCFKARPGILRPGKIKSTSRTTHQSRKVVLDQVANRVANVDELTFSQERRGFGKVRQREGRLGIGSFEQIRMIAHLSKLHDQVHQRGCVLIVPESGFFDQIHDADTASEIAVVGSLTVRQIAEDILLHLVPKFLLYMGLDTAQHEGFEDHVQTLQLVLIELRVALSMAFDILGEPVAELVVGVEQGGHDEMKQSPQLLHVVLYGSSRE